MTILMVLYAIMLLYIIYRMSAYFKHAKCRCTTNMYGRVVVITGASSGVGFETARELARRGARVIMACRDPARGAAAQQLIVKETNNENVVIKYLDLSSFESVHNFAQDVLRTELKLDVLINNAAVGKLDNSLTEDNLPIETQINYYGPFLLTMMLLPLIKKSKPSRIINVSSVMHWVGKVDLSKFHCRARSYLVHSRVFADTKLAMILFTLKLSQKVRDAGVTVNSVHPGIVWFSALKGCTVVIRFLLCAVLKSTLQGAQTLIHLCMSPKISNHNGRYFAECKPTSVSHVAMNQRLADKLWAQTEKIVLTQNHVAPN